MAKLRGILTGGNKNNPKTPQIPFPNYPEDIRRITYFFENPDSIESFSFSSASESLNSVSHHKIPSEASSSFSSMATCTDNPGPGRTLDTHVFQPLGRLLEKALARCRPKIAVQNESADESSYTSDSSSDFSTMATCTNNPGPGRIIDTHFYQPCGRYIERILMNIEQKHFRTPQWNADRILRDLDFPMVPLAESEVNPYIHFVFLKVLQGCGLEHTPKDPRERREWYIQKLKPFKDAIFRSTSVTMAFRRLLIQAR